MKKLLLLGALLSTAAFAEGNVIEGRIGYDLTSNSNVTIANEKYDLAKRGFEIAGEYRKEITDNFELGAGIAYKHSKFKNYEKIENATNGVTEYGAGIQFEGKSLRSIPVYAVAKYNFKNDSEVNPYVKAKLGYSFNSGKINAIYAAGAVDATNVDTNNVVAEAGEIKAKSGLYYGVGAGIEYKGFTVDLSYNVNSVKLQGNIDRASVYNSEVSSVSSYEFRKNANHNTVTLSVGYAFKF